jgi:hypothetical protein
MGSVSTEDIRFIRAGEEENDMPISVSMIVVSSQLVVAVADRVPEFDIVRSCKLDLAIVEKLCQR